MLLLGTINTSISAGPDKIHKYYNVKVPPEHSPIGADEVGAIALRLQEFKIEKLQIQLADTRIIKELFSIINAANIKSVAFKISLQHIDELFQEISHSNIEFLDLSGNNLFKIGDNLHEHIIKLAGSKITGISFSFNGLGGLPIESIKIFLSSLKYTNISHIDLSHNKLGLLPQDDFLQIMPAIVGTNITSLSMKGNFLNKQTPFSLTHFIKNTATTNISMLNLSLNELGRLSTESLNEITRALNETQISTLDLSNNLLTLQSEDNITYFIKSLRYTRITELNLSKNDFEKKSNDYLEKVLIGLADTNIKKIHINNLCSHQGLENIIDNIPKYVEIHDIEDNIHITAHNLTVQVNRALINRRYYFNISLPSAYKNSEHALSELIKRLNTKNSCIISNFAAVMLMVGEIESDIEYNNIEDYIERCGKSVEIFLQCCKHANSELLFGFYASMSLFYINFASKFDTDYINNKNYSNFKIYISKILKTIRNELLENIYVSNKAFDSNATDCIKNLSTSGIGISTYDYISHPTILFKYDGAESLKTNSEKSLIEVLDVIPPFTLSNTYS